MEHFEVYAKLSEGVWGPLKVPSGSRAQIRGRGGGVASRKVMDFSRFGDMQIFFRAHSILTVYGEYSGFFLTCFK